jgi:membrane fusion protein (multidrug efflux system)
VRATFPNPDRVLLPGMFVRARIEEGINDRAMLVPLVGITHNQKGEAVALVVGPDNKVAPRTVVTTGMHGSNWVVDSGLQPGERVIVQGVDKARPGTVVKTVPAQIAEAPASGASPASGAVAQAASGA